MTDIVWMNEKRRLSDLREWEDNPRLLMEHDANELDKSLSRFGLSDPLIINLDNTLIGGHQRRRRMIELFGLDYEADVRVPSRMLTPPEMRELAIRLNRNQGKWDMDMLANNFDLGELLDFGFTEKDFGFTLPDVTPEPEDEQPELERADVPDAVWPTDNDWGVPLLDINLQASAVDLPFVTWGTGEYPRKSRMPGTWHFYTSDDRFEALWSDPSPVINSRAVNAVEPNFSVYNQMPPAVALWNVYRKRWIARWWQACGLRVLADLNVAEPHYQLNMLGIPKGWKSWCTRGYTDRMDNTIMEYDMAVEHAGTSSILFVVYGGGKAVKELCQSRGWLWFDEQRNTERGSKYGKE